MLSSIYVINAIAFFYVVRLYYSILCKKVGAQKGFLPSFLYNCIIKLFLFKVNACTHCLSGVRKKDQV